MPNNSRPAPMMRGRMRGGGEKAKDTRGALMKLISYCKNQAGIIIFALVLAAIGAVFTIVGPNQISRLTDYIYDGLSGGGSTEEITAEIARQIEEGEIDIYKYLPEGVEISDIDLTNTESELTQEILNNISLSEEYQKEHENDGIDMSGILSVAMLLIGIYFASALCNFVQHYIMQTVTQRTARKLRGDIDTKINRLPLKYFSGNAAGDVLSRMTNDVDMIGQAMSNSVSNLVTAAAQFVGCLIMNKQSQITDATREAFVTAFFLLAENKNIYSITIREITETAGYNRTTFYRYFQDVFALIEYAEDEFINDMLNSTLPVLGEGNELNEEFFRVYLSKFYEHRDRLSVLFGDQNRAHFIQRIQEQTSNRLNLHIADTPENKVVMYIYLTGIFSAMAAHIQNPTFIDDEKLLGIIRRLFQNWYWKEVTRK